MDEGGCFAGALFAVEGLDRVGLEVFGVLLDGLIFADGVSVDAERFGDEGDDVRHERYLVVELKEKKE